MQKMRGSQKQTSFKRNIGGRSFEFTQKDGVTSILTKSFEKSEVLFANYSRGNMPSNLTNVISTSQELFGILKSLEEQELDFNQQKQLVIYLKIFSNTKVYRLPLQRAELSLQDKLLNQNGVLAEQLNKLKQNNAKLSIELSKSNFALKMQEEMQEKRERAQKRLIQQEIASIIFKYQVQITKLKSNFDSQLQNYLQRELRLQEHIIMLQDKLKLTQDYHKKQIEQISIDKGGKRIWNRSDVSLHRRPKDCAKWVFNWQNHASSTSFFNINGNLVTRNAKQPKAFYKLLSHQTIPKDKNVKIEIKIIQYGRYGDIIVGVQAEETTNPEILNKVGQQDLIYYRSYQSKGDNKGRVFEYVSSNCVVPFLREGQTLTIEVDRKSNQLFWSTLKQGLVHVSQLDRFSGKQLVFFVSLFENGDCIEIC